MRIFVVPLLWVACGVQVDEPIVPAVSCIEASVAEVDFGTVHASSGEIDESSREVVLSNACAAPVHINNLEASNEVHFTVHKWQDEVIHPGESRSVFLSFRPRRPGQHTSRLYIDSTASNLPHMELRLRGRLSAPELQFRPAVLHLDALTVGCKKSYVVAIRNVGNTHAMIEGVDLITSSTQEIQLREGALTERELPIRLAPYNEDWGTPQIEVVVDYQPLDEVPDTAQLRVLSDDPMGRTRELQIAGTAVDDMRVLEAFDVPMVPKVDVLFTLDHTLHGHNGRIIDAIPSLTHMLNALRVDYRVAAIVEDGGCMLGPHIDSTLSASEARAAFDRMVDRDSVIFPHGSRTNRGFGLAQSALRVDGIGCNVEFYRADADLSVIHTSDTQELRGAWTTYVPELRRLKSDPDRVRIHAVAGDYPTGCPGATAGAGYYEATVATGGVFRSICDTDWTAHHEALAEASVWPNNRFMLSKPPAEHTIEVRVDDALVEAGWHLDRAVNAITFGPEAMPSGGARVQVSYARPINCPE